MSPVVGLADVAAGGVEMHSLMQMFGWAMPSTAERYLARNPDATARELDSMHR